MAGQWLPAVGLTAFVAVAGLIAGLAPRDAARVAVIGPPAGGFAGTMTIVAAAGGAVVGVGRLPWIVTTERGDAAFINDLYDAGAWAVLDARAAAGCLPFEPLQASRRP